MNKETVQSWTKPCTQEGLAIPGFVLGGGLGGGGGGPGGRKWGGSLPLQALRADLKHYVTQDTISAIKGGGRSTGNTRKILQCHLPISHHPFFFLPCIQCHCRAFPSRTTLELSQRSYFISKERWLKFGSAFGPML